jgi:hypothetical protein
MTADTYAKLIVLETLIDAEIGFLLEHRPSSMESFREELVARLSDLVDEIDALDATAAASAYDALVDLLADLPEDDDEGVISATLRFKRATDRIVERGMDRSGLDEAFTWAVVVDELLRALTDEYHQAVRHNGETVPRPYLRAQVILARAAEAADRMEWAAGVDHRTELREWMDRLTFAVRHQRLKPTEIDLMVRPVQRRTRKYRPSTLTRVGTFVLRHLLRRSTGGPGGEPRPA